MYSIASKVLFEPVPAITGILLSVTLIVSSIIFLCSSCDKVGDSPVVPQGTSPWDPLSIKWVKTFVNES